MPTTITYDVMKRAPGSFGDFYLHVIMDAPLACFNEEAASFETLGEAYACAEKLGRRFETKIRVVETTTHTYDL